MKNALIAALVAALVAAGTSNAAQRPGGATNAQRGTSSHLPAKVRALRVEVKSLSAQLDEYASEFDQCVQEGPVVSVTLSNGETVDRRMLVDGCSRP